MSKQMYKVHQPHLQSGYLAETHTESALDADGDPDWILRYVPGPKAYAEYQAFHHRRHAALGRPLIRGREETEPTLPLSISGDEPSAVQPEARETKQNQADSLVQQFYRDVHGVADKPPHPQELAHASGLLQRYGSEFAAFFLSYAKRVMRQDDRTAHVFGGLMRYEASALAAYRRQAAQTAAQQAESGAQQRRRRLNAYEAWLRLQLDALKETLPPEELEALREQARRQARSHQQIPSYLLTRQVEHEVETQLIQMHGLPSFEVWSAHDEMAAHRHQLHKRERHQEGEFIVSQ